MLGTALGAQDYDQVNKIRKARCLRRNVKLAKLMRGEVQINPEPRDDPLEAYKAVIAKQRLVYSEKESVLFGNISLPMTLEDRMLAGEFRPKN